MRVLLTRLLHEKRRAEYVLKQIDVSHVLPLLQLASVGSEVASCEEKIWKSNSSY
jgi:hypothetical protein